MHTVVWCSLSPNVVSVLITTFTHVVERWRAGWLWFPPPHHSVALLLLRSAGDPFPIFLFLIWPLYRFCCLCFCLPPFLYLNFYLFSLPTPSLFAHAVFLLMTCGVFCHLYSRSLFKLFIYTEAVAFEVPLKSRQFLKRGNWEQVDCFFHILKRQRGLQGQVKVRNSFEVWMLFHKLLNSAEKGKVLGKTLQSIECGKTHNY